VRRHKVIRRSLLRSRHHDGRGPLHATSAESG
jgi:hypothetical protein